MRNNIIHKLGIVATLALIAACFLPWTHYNQINITFTGFSVVPFSTGNYYGKSGIPITIFSVLILLFMFLPYAWAKKANLFLSGILFAYTVRTYIIFTSALFEGEVKKLPGIYLIVGLSLIVLVSSFFPVTGKNTEIQA